MAVVRAAVDKLISAPTHIVYAPVTHPGHHTGASFFGGFCFINNAVVAARLLQSRYPRVAIIDIDYHCPNGTISLLWDDPSMFLASIHADPSFDYPFNVGFDDDIGAHDNMINIPMSKGTDLSLYLPTLQKCIERLVVRTEFCLWILERKGF
jgi:acetoin utilization deacetylase AcuC-like enzyme